MITFTNCLENPTKQVKQSEGRRNDGRLSDSVNQVSYTHPHFLLVISIYALAFYGNDHSPVIAIMP
jgi:hypothetical protein